MKTQSFGCGCFLKVYVCPGHLAVASEELEDKMQALTRQLHLGILDTEVSVSALERERVDGS